MSSRIEPIVRGVQISSGMVLLVKQAEANHAFLPGGHISFLESAEKALRREVMEELGRETSVGEFLGAVEHIYRSDGQSRHELNILLRIEVEGVRLDAEPESRESGPRFFWHPVDRLSEVNLQPYPLQTILPHLSRKKGTASWATTIIRVATASCVRNQSHRGS